MKRRPLPRESLYEDSMKSSKCLISELSSGPYSTWPPETKKHAPKVLFMWLSPTTTTTTTTGLRPFVRDYPGEPLGQRLGLSPTCCIIHENKAGSTILTAITHHLYCTWQTQSLLLNLALANIKLKPFSKCLYSRQTLPCKQAKCC